MNDSTAVAKKFQEMAYAARAKAAQPGGEADRIVNTMLEKIEKRAKEGWQHLPWPDAGESPLFNIVQDKLCKMGFSVPRGGSYKDYINVEW